MGLSANRIVRRELARSRAECFVIVKNHEKLRGARDSCYLIMHC